MSEFVWTPTPELIAQSTLTAFLRRTGCADYDALVRRADADPAWFWGEVIRFFDLRFYRPYEQVLDLSQGLPWARWCVGGTTNMVLNCLDRHRGTPVWDRTYLVWEGETGARRTLSYRDFDAEVCRLANALRSLGIGRGDAVGIFLPNLPEAFAAFFAIAKVGGIVMPLFSGFGPEPLALRLADGGARAVITSDGAWRRGKPGAMKAVLDEALRSAPTVEHVIVVRYLGEGVETPMTPGRDHWWHERVAPEPPEARTEEMGASDPAVLIYTSGTTGKPKGAVWTHISNVAKMSLDFGVCLDFKPEDRFFFMSDMGWMVGPMSAMVPSMFGGSVLLAEGAPDYPDTARLWRLIQDHRVTFLGVSPTLVRGMMRYGDEAVACHDLSSVRITCSSGEPWTDTPWHWFFDHVCKRRLPLLNISGGTEVGCLILTGTVHHKLKPCSFGGPVPGMGADVVDEAGRSCPPGQVGELVLRQTSIGLTKSLWRDDQRYVESYWNVIPGLWVHGDFAQRDADGCWYILGRSDDTIKVSGKRTGPSELENLLMKTEKLVECAVVGVPDELKGSAIVCVCVARPGVATDAALKSELSRALVAGMGASYRPRRIVFARDLPKTRNLKVMRRVVRAALTGGSAGDLSALVNPDVVEELRASRLAGA